MANPLPEAPPEMYSKSVLPEITEELLFADELDLAEELLRAIEELERTEELELTA